MKILIWRQSVTSDDCLICVSRLHPIIKNNEFSVSVHVRVEKQLGSDECCRATARTPFEKNRTQYLLFSTSDSVIYFASINSSREMSSFCTQSACISTSFGAVNLPFLAIFQVLASNYYKIAAEMAPPPTVWPSDYGEVALKEGALL